jgi:hypothetical protein
MRSPERIPLLKSIIASGALIVCAALAGTVFAQGAGDDDPEYQFDYNPALKKSWREAEVPPPPPIDEANLVQLETAPTTVNDVLVDATSVQLGQDRVVRLGFIIVSGSVRNALYEGIHCTTRRYKTYAFGKPDGGWQPMQQSEWTAIRELGANAFRYDLFRLICNQDDSPRSERDIVRRLKYRVDYNQP